MCVLSQVLNLSFIKELIMVSLSCSEYCYHHIVYCLLMIELVVVTGQPECPIWHTYSKDSESCQCCSSVDRLAKCEKEYVYVVNSHCLTWNNATDDVEISRCLYIDQDLNLCGITDMYRLSIDITGPKLNSVTCKPYHRDGTQCQYCIDGYGPAAFSDGVSCADCSRHKYFWLLNLLFQLVMVTLLYLVVVFFQIKGTCSPFNVIITNCQLGLSAILIGSGLRALIVCMTGRRFTKILLTLFGVFNLDFFRFVIPPLCISPSLKSIHVLLFDYIIAVYPIIITVVIYVSIELYDRSLSAPVRILWCRNWRPKETILSTCATFLLLSYTKFLSVSINLLYSVHVRDCNGEVIPNSFVLLYDPSVKFLHSEHIPYVILALFVIIVFVLFPPLLLLLYPTRLFRKCLNCYGFRRWDILHLVMDVFQGWYKDGTEGTYDYRSFSALYMILRIVLSLAFFELLTFESYDVGVFKVVVGLLYALLWIMFFVLKPYKVSWMNYTDGAVSLMLSFFSLNYGVTSFAFNVGIILIALIVCIYRRYTSFKKCSS